MNGALKLPIGIVVAALMLGACAHRADDDAATAPHDPSDDKWAANGWLSPGPTGEPEIIGLYKTRRDCEAAVDAWLSRQVVSHPIHGECLPIDRN